MCVRLTEAQNSSFCLLLSNFSRSRVKTCFKKGSWSRGCWNSPPCLLTSSALFGPPTHPQHSKQRNNRLVFFYAPPRTPPASLSTHPPKTPQPTNQRNNQPTNQTTNQPSNTPTNQTTKQPTKQTISSSLQYAPRGSPPPACPAGGPRCGARRRPRCAGRRGRRARCGPRPSRGAGA